MIIKNLDWEKTEAYAKDLKLADLLGAYLDCVDCIKKGVPNEGYYYDQASVYRIELNRRNVTNEEMQKAYEDDITRGF